MEAFKLTLMVIGGITIIVMIFIVFAFFVDDIMELMERYKRTHHIRKRPHDTCFCGDCYHWHGGDLEKNKCSIWNKNTNKGCFCVFAEPIKRKGR